MSESTPMDGSGSSRHHMNPQLEDLLQEGIDAARSGASQRGRDLFLQVLEQDPSSVPAWLWLSDVVDTPGQKQLCLEQVLSIDPTHIAARRGLDFLWERREGQRHHAEQVRSSVWNRPAEAEPHLPAPFARAARPVPSVVEAAAAITPGGAASPGEGMDDLMRPAIAAARSGHVQRARELLARVIALDETHVSAWMWLSYIASDEEERDRCLRKVLALAVPGMVPTLAPAGAIAGGGSEAQPRLARVSRSGSRPAQAAPLRTHATAHRVARPALPRLQLPDAAFFDGAGITARLRTLYLERATSWTFIALVYLAAIAVAEILTTFAPPRLGLVAHAAVLLVVLIHAARMEEKKEQAFLVSLAFAPLIRVLSLSLPLANLPLLYWYPITSIPLFVALLVAAPTLGYRWSDLGLNLRRFGLQLVVALSGVAFGVFEYWILQPEPLVAAVEWTALLWPALILLISTGLLEEMLFRGLLQPASIDVLGLWGIGYVAILFAVLHTGYRSLPDILFVAAVGLFFGWVVYRTRSLVGVTLAHGLTNIILFLVMPFVLG